MKPENQKRKGGNKMKAIIISEQNKEKIEARINEAQGRSKERTITAKDVFLTVQDLETFRKNHNIPKAAMEGTEITADPNAQDFPNAYKWTPMSTQYMIRFEKGKYKLYDVQRTACRRYGREIFVGWPDAAKERILEAAAHLF